MLNLDASRNCMDEQKKKEIRQKIRNQFRLGRVRLFRVEDESRTRGQIADDKARVLAAFKTFGPAQELDLTQCLARLLMNFSKLASYHGVLEGYNIFRIGLELGEDRARFYLMKYLQTHRSADNEELIEYLDRKNGTLAKLKTAKDSSLWAPLRESWQDMFRRKNIPLIAGEYWGTALDQFPEVVRPYLSLVKRKAQEPKFKNVLFIWPRIISEHKRQRRARSNVA
jgi:hypothetical protein